MVASPLKILSIVFLALVAMAVPAASAGSPSSTIKQFNDALLTVMREADKLRFDGRYSRLQPVLRNSFDLPFMAQFSAGRHWKELSGSERDGLVDTFSRLWISTYADRFNDYSGESFEIVGEAPAPRDTILVRTNIVKKDGDRIALDYLMRQSGGAWSVIDIFLKGKYSELAKQRAEYTSVLKREGLDGLVAKVEDKVRRMKANDR